jgi:tRNA uridine 5-carbamoylmethylation protein Kti12
MKDTLVIGAIGGPSAGKSTISGGLFNKLKTAGHNVEYVQEFAKTLTWEKNFEALKHQFYVSGVQSYTQDMLLGQVEAIITDSPLIIGLMYYRESNELIRRAFETFIIESFRRQNNITFFVNRKRKYNPIGRTQKEEEAIEIDNRIKKLFIDNNLKYIEVDGDDSGLEKAYNIVLKELQ